MKKIFICILLAIGIIGAGCAQKKVVQPVQPETGQQMQQQQPPVTPGESEQRRGVLRPDERITERQMAKIETKEDLPQYKEESGLFEDIRFDYDKYDIAPEAKTVLQNVASWLLKNTSAKLSIEGHCDERGTNEYNLALGDRRAKAARDFLIAMGIASNRIEMVSYGEEKPLCTDSSEECWAKNRRDHFVVLREKGR